MDDYKQIETEEFKKEFWRWWDQLPRAERDKFNYYKSDMAFLNFFNRVWRHKKNVE